MIIFQLSQATKNASLNRPEKFAILWRSRSLFDTQSGVIREKCRLVSQKRTTSHAYRPETGLRNHEKAAKVSVTISSLALKGWSILEPDDGRLRQPSPSPPACRSPLHISKRSNIGRTHEFGINTSSPTGYACSTKRSSVPSGKEKVAKPRMAEEGPQIFPKLSFVHLRVRFLVAVP